MTPSQREQIVEHFEETFDSFLDENWIDLNQAEKEQIVIEYVNCILGKDL